MYKIKPYPEQGGVLLFLSLGIIFVKDSWVILSRFSGISYTKVAAFSSI